MTSLGPATPTRQLEVRLARDASDILAAQRLRYRVFVEELGGGGELVDHAGKFERDRFDPFFDHIVLVDPCRDPEDLEHVVGVYRVLLPERAIEAGQFYSEDEYDLGVLRRSGRRLMELGRSCLYPDYRGSAAMARLWAALSDYVNEHRIEILFGVASFHGTDPAPLAAPLSLLHHRHRAPEALRVRAREPYRVDMDLLPESALDRRAAMRAVPSLIKAYLKLGGFVGDGAFIDRAFNTIDVCLVLDAAQVNARQRDLYLRERG